MTHEDETTMREVAMTIIEQLIPFDDSSRRRIVATVEAFLFQPEALKKEVSS